MSILGNNLLAQYYVQQEALPNEYRRVEYLESTGTQYIDTLMAVSDKLDISAEIQFNTTAVFQINGGAFRDSINTYRADIGINDNKFFFGCSSNVVFQTITADTLKHFFRINTHTGEWWLDEVTGSVAPVVYPNNRLSIYIGARKYNNRIEAYCKENIYLYQIKYSDIFVRNFIPCVRKSDNKPGLYDLCKSICPLTGNSFYINAGTGEFVTP